MPDPMMPMGFNLPTGPIQQYTPEMLAQMAALGFKPPGLMQSPGMGGQQQVPGFNVGDGMAGLGMGLAALGKGKPDVFMGKERTAGDRDLNGYGASPVDPMSGNPNAQPVEVFNPTGAIKATGGGGPLDWIRRQFGWTDPLTGRPS